MRYAPRFGLGVPLALAFAAPALAQITFTDVTNAAKLGNETYDAKTNHGLGSAWIDVNLDGYPDLFCVNGKGGSPHLYLNRTDGSFKLRDELLPPLPNVEMPAALVADYDNDGDYDIYVLCDNETNTLVPTEPSPQDGPPNLLLKNQWMENGGAFLGPGNPLFVDVAAAAGVDDLAPSPLPSVTGSNYPGFRAITGSWLDYDRDGFVDLYVGHWSPHNHGTLACWDRLFRNKGDGTFEDVTAAVGLPGDTDFANMKTVLAAVGAHLDQDLWPDLYWAHIAPGGLGFPEHQDFFWRNDGAGGFVQATFDSPGLGDDSAAAMGISVGDLDLDGDWEFYIADIFATTNDALPLGNPLYVNNGDGTFQDNTADVAGVDFGTSWSNNFLDADLDGYEDIFVASAGPTAGQNILYRNNGDMTFTDVSATANVAAPGAFGARGSSVADYDRDGDLDILVNYDDGKAMQLLRNDTVTTNHWLGVRLEATTSNRAAIGAVVKVEAGPFKLMRQITGGNAAHSQDDRVPLFGLGAATRADLITVLWPSGQVTYLKDVAPNQYITIVEAPTGIRSYGDACSGQGAYAPSLMVSGDVSPGGTVNLDVVSGFGGGGLFYVYGTGQGNTPAAGCSLLVQNVFGVVFLGSLSGSGAGHGNSHLPVTIPPSTPSGVVTIQAFVTAAGIPLGASATNGVELTLYP